MIPIMHPTGVACGGQSQCLPFQQLVLEGDSQVVEDVLVVCTHYRDKAIPSWVRWDLPDSDALCLCSVGACESPCMPVQASLS